MTISKKVKKDIAARRHNIGSVSTATMRNEDLIPCFVAHLRGQKTMTEAHGWLAGEVEAHMEADDYYESDASDEDMEALFEALDCYGPEGFYFGAHPGDGADYGWWLSESFMEDFEGLKVGDLAAIPPAYEGEVLVVNDHGNPSLYLASKGDVTECWGLV